jgi:hypothetical protein
MAAATTATAPTAAPVAPVTTVTAAPSKKHVRKPDDFIDVKDANKFKRQVFVYINEYAADFDTDEKRIRFTLSFMTGGLPEKFAANFIDQVIDQATAGVYDWGTVTAFQAQFDEAFEDKNKKSNAENQIALLKQGSKTAEEFFQEFDQLAFVAGYNDGHHGDILIKLIKDAIHNSIIDSIYNAGTLPDTYANWKVRITSIDNLQRQRAVEKKSHAPTVVHKTIVVDKSAATAANAPAQRTGTGTIYGGAGQKMDIDKARQSGLCFKCGKPGHISRNCPDRKAFQIRSIVEGLNDEEKKELKKELENPKQGFQEAQQ